MHEEFKPNTEKSVVVVDPNSTGFPIIVEQPSEWKCYLYGTKEYILWPTKGNVPNWFWRKMQYLLMGNKWVKTDGK